MRSINKHSLISTKVCFHVSGLPELPQVNIYTADKEYAAVKVISKEKLNTSKAKLAEAEDEIRDLFQSMENVGYSAVTFLRPSYKTLKLET
jgi:hypothetical protein